jgi:hypothetical protein
LNVKFFQQVADLASTVTKHSLVETLTITLATAETVTEAQILGMRIILISGEGTGQYGYVYAYNSAQSYVQFIEKATATRLGSY